MYMQCFLELCMSSVCAFVFHCLCIPIRALIELKGVSAQNTYFSVLVDGQEVQKEGETPVVDLGDLYLGQTSADRSFILSNTSSLPLEFSVSPLHVQRCMYILSDSPIARMVTCHLLFLLEKIFAEKALDRAALVCGGLSAARRGCGSVPFVFLQP
jgi:hypothetical protein